MEPTQTALIVQIPEAEPAVRAWRARYDRAASWGVPAHVTVLYPFLPPERIDADVLAAVGTAVASVARFTADFTRVRWFGDRVVWLAPTPAEPFRTLTAAVCRLFPQVTPYGGAHPEVIPHLTIGHDAPRTALAEAADAVSRRLPLRSAVEAVQLIAGGPHPGGWQTMGHFPLGS